MNVLLWIDDEREMPEGFTHHAKTSGEAIDILSNLAEEDVLVLVSFDHDLGYPYEDGHDKLDGGEPGDTGLIVAKWMVKHDIFPEAVVIHSHNPIGAKAIRDTLHYDGPTDLKMWTQPYNPKDYE